MTAEESATTTPRTRFDECEECRRAFEPAREWARFCSDSCRSANWRRSQTKSPPMREHQAGRMGQEVKLNHHSTIQPGTKLHAVAGALCRGERLDCFMAVRAVHDYTLRSTISELANRYGVAIERTPKTVPGHTGSSVHCVEYHVGESGAAQLAKLLAWPVCGTRR